jgi:hypothetical protein
VRTAPANSETPKIVTLQPRTSPPPLQLQPHRLRPRNAHNGQYKATEHAGAQQASSDTLQTLSLRRRTPALTRHRRALLHDIRPSCHTDGPAATRLQITSPEAVGRRRRRIGPRGQVLLASRDVPGHVCLDGAVFPTTVSNPRSALRALTEHVSDSLPGTRFTIPSKKAPSHPASAASTPCGGIPQARNDALLASFARLSARLRPSQLRRRSARTAAGGPRVTILI